MLIAVINQPDFNSATQAIEQISTMVDALELRLDYWQQLNIDEVVKLRKQFSIPMIFTLRKKSQGGLYQLNEQQRLQDLQKLCELNPEYIDVEFDIDNDFLQDIKQRYPDIKLICSYHDYEQTPKELSALLTQMQNKKCHSYKIAAQANCAMDAVRMLDFVNDSAKSVSLTGISMGEFGTVTRIMGKILGGQFTFAALASGQESAPGQLSCEELNNIYHYQQLNAETKVFALLGDPISKSVGHIWHNKAYQLLNKNAVYIKMRVLESEAAQVIQELKELPFYGFSVTMPLKEIAYAAMDELDTMAKNIKAVNTIVVKNQHYIGSNTDGAGAMKALAQQVKSLENENIVILGAGGSARAIIYAAKQLGANVYLFNRSINRAQLLADEFSCYAYSLAQLSELKKINYKVVINTLPVSAQEENLSFLKSVIISSEIVAMDIVYNPVNTPFLQLAKAAGCVCIPGYEMYVEQALLQLECWFGLSKDDLTEIRSQMR